MTERTCIIFNPAAGRGKAARLIASAKLAPNTELRPTTGPRTATTIAQAAAEEGFSRIVAAGGDGTVHEVANGLLIAERTGVRFSVWPMGSMNDYAFTLGLGEWYRTSGDHSQLHTLQADVGLFEAVGIRRYFINNCGIGFNGWVTVEAQKIRWLRGSPLYSLALVKTLLRHFTAPLLQVEVDGVRSEFRSLGYSIGLGQREGGFPLAPLAKLDDDRFDLLRVGDIHRWEVVRYFPRMMTGNLPTDNPKIVTSQGREITIRSEEALCIHVDGEVLCVPGDGVREARITLLSRRLPVEYYPPAAYGGGRYEYLRK
jgi:diacylglycerol kinase (ATP)